MGLRDFWSKEEPMPIEQVKDDPDLFRVGVTIEGKTTLTFLKGFNSMTLTMTPEFSERLIRMLRATYTDIKDDEQEKDS